MPFVSYRVRDTGLPEDPTRTDFPFEFDGNPMGIEEDWVTEIRGQCLEACVPFFVKQWVDRTVARSRGELGMKCQPARLKPTRESRFVTRVNTLLDQQFGLFIGSHVSLVTMSVPDSALHCQPGLTLVTCRYPFAPVLFAFCRVLKYTGCRGGGGISQGFGDDMTAYPGIPLQIFSRCLQCCIYVGCIRVHRTSKGYELCST